VIPWASQPVDQSAVLSARPVNVPLNTRRHVPDGFPAGRAAVDAAPAGATDRVTGSARSGLPVAEAWQAARPRTASPAIIAIPARRTARASRRRTAQATIVFTYQPLPERQVRRGRKHPCLRALRPDSARQQGEPIRAC
jgi:hypothetical protein